MKKQLLAAAAFALASTASYAQLELQYADVPVASKTARADVKAEYLRAQAAGELPAGELVLVSPPPANSNVTRADVRNELLQARAAGRYVTIGDSVQFASDVTGPARSREEVRAEARAHTRAGIAARVQAGH